MYHRYHIETAETPEVAEVPSRFRVKVKRRGLAFLLVKELVHYRFNLPVVLSRPCVYGVFSGPVGGFAPRHHLCVGCLRCTTEHPDFVQVLPNPARKRLGDSYFTPNYVENIYYEARTGKIPVRGAGYRGPFGGDGWDGMWTDMSEIVRPTRDGIHGREFISTSVDIGTRPPYLVFDERGRPSNGRAHVISIPLPMLFDAPPTGLLSEALAKSLCAAAEETGTLAVLPLRAIAQYSLARPCVAPQVKPSEMAELANLSFQPALIELLGWDEGFHHALAQRFPSAAVCVRVEAGTPQDLVRMADAGARVFHLVANYHGRWPDGRFMLDVIRDAHRAFVKLDRRDEVTLLGTGGIIAAEHVPKSILCGLDAVALDTPVLVALQAQFQGECADRARSAFVLPASLNPEWGAQRLKNLLGSWRDQSLEMLGAMGLREMRRLRGEIGRAMFQKELEREAFTGIEGYGQ